MLFFNICTFVLLVISRP